MSATVTQVSATPGTAKEVVSGLQGKHQVTLQRLDAGCFLTSDAAATSGLEFGGSAAVGYSYRLESDFDSEDILYVFQPGTGPDYTVTVMVTTL